MLRNRYRTNQLTVEAKASKRISRVVILSVSVKLLERNEKIHVGRVIVMKLTIQYSRLGTMVKTPKSRPPSMPAVDWTPAGPGALGAVVEVVWLASEVSDSVNMEGSVPSTREASIFTRVELTCTAAACS